MRLFLKGLFRDEKSSCIVQLLLYLGFEDVIVGEDAL